MDGVRRSVAALWSPLHSLSTPVVLLVLAGLVGGCGPTHALVLVNRSDTTIAFYPQVVVPACSSLSLSDDQLRVAKDALLEAIGNDDQSWIPAGAKEFRIGVAPRPLEAPDPQTIVVSGTEAPRSIDGFVMESELPDCGGEPVGVS